MTACTLFSISFGITVAIGLFCMFCAVGNRTGKSWLRVYFCSWHWPWSFKHFRDDSDPWGDHYDMYGKGGKPMMGKGKGKGKFDMQKGMGEQQPMTGKGEQQPMMGKGEAQGAPQQAPMKGMPGGKPMQGKPQQGAPVQQKGEQKGLAMGGKDGGKGEQWGKGKAGQKGGKGFAQQPVVTATTEEYVAPSNVAEPTEPAAAVEQQAGARPLIEGMRIALTVDVINATGLPSVNTFGGCDPYVEIRCVKGDPVARLKNGGNINEVPRDSAKTTTKDGDLTPDWNETLCLHKAIYGKDKFFNFVLWDSNITKNTPIGYHSINSMKLLEGLTYDPKTVAPSKKTLKATDFVSLLEDKSMSLKSELNLKLSFVERHKFTIKVKNASHLPKVDTLGSIDAFVEARVVEGDPGQMEFNNSPGAETMCNGKTKVVSDNMDPTFNETIEFEYDADPKLNLIIAVVDQGTLGNTPVGFVTVPFMMLCSDADGSEHEFNKCKLKKIPNWPEPQNLEKATVSFTVTHTLAKGE